MYMHFHLQYANAIYIYICVFAENKPLKVLIEFSLEKPQGGVQFVLPPDGTTPEAMVGHHH